MNLGHNFHKGIKSLKDNKPESSFLRVPSQSSIIEFQYFTQKTKIIMSSWRSLSPTSTTLTCDHCPTLKPSKKTKFIYQPNCLSESVDGSQMVNMSYSVLINPPQSGENGSVQKWVTSRVPRSTYKVLVK